MEKTIDYYKSLQKYYVDLSKRMELNHDSDIAKYVSDCSKKEKNFLKEFEDKGLLRIEGFIDKSILLDIKNKVEYFIDNKINLNPIREPKGGYVVAADSKESTTNYLQDLTNIETKTPTVSIKDPLVNIKELIPLVFHEEVISKVTAYFNTLPMVTFVKIIKHFPNEMQSSVNDWHIDGPPGAVGSPKLIKAIYYLDDIDQIEKGPYCYVEGSHQDRIEYNKRSFSNNEILEYYGEEKVKPALGNIGDIVFTRGELVHKAGKPTSKPRTIIIINYCIHEEYLDTPGADFSTDKVKIELQDVNKIRFSSLTDDLIKI